MRFLNNGGRRLFGLIFARYVPLRSQTPYPIVVHSVANYRPILVTFGQTCNLSDPNFTFHIQYKHSGKFANRKYGELSYPKKSEIVQPHSSNAIENDTISTHPLPPLPLWVRYKPQAEDIAVESLELCKLNRT